MRVTKDWENEGWTGISLGLRPEEIDHLVSMLLALKDDHDQHFHLSSKYEGDPGIGDIEIYVQGSETSNMSMLGLAAKPGASEDV